MELRRWTTTCTAAFALLFVGADVLLAQGRGEGPHQGPPDVPPGLHDRALPPGFGGEPPGQDTPPGQMALSGVAEAAVTAAARDLSAALAARDFRATPEIALASRTQAHLHDVLTGELRGVALARSLERPENRGARSEARALGQSLEGLLQKPETLPQAVLAFNAFVMASSDDFLAAPPEEFLAVHAALERLTIAAQEAADAPTSE